MVNPTPLVLRLFLVGLETVGLPSGPCKRTYENVNVHSVHRQTYSRFKMGITSSILLSFKWPWFLWHMHDVNCNQIYSFQGNDKKLWNLVILTPLLHVFMQDIRDMYMYILHITLYGYCYRHPTKLLIANKLKVLMPSDTPQLTLFHSRYHHLSLW